MQDQRGGGHSRRRNGRPAPPTQQNDGGMSATPSVLQITLWNSPYLGNFMRSELYFADAIRKRFSLGTHFVLADGAQGQPWLADLERSGASWSILPAHKPTWGARLAHTAQELDSALVHAHFTAADIPAALTARRRRIPCVWHVRTGFNGYPVRQRAKDLIKMRLVARRDVDCIITVSPWLAELVRRRGAPAGRIEVLPNPIVGESLTSMPDRVAARERFGLSPDAEVVLGLGWWPDVKGADVLVRAVQRLASSHPTLELLLVGEQQMEDFLDQMLPERPAWLHTSPFVEDAAWLFAAADVFVSASRHEGQSSAVGEALACGLQVVMSDIAGTSGWAAAPHVSTFPSEDDEALAGAVERILLMDPAERTRSGAENHRWSLRETSPERWADRLCSIYATLLEGA
jgi:glycosyltransferase involved in cell wall biosynthesis